MMRTEVSLEWQRSDWKNFHPAVHFNSECIAPYCTCVHVSVYVHKPPSVCIQCLPPGMMKVNEETNKSANMAAQFDQNAPKKKCKNQRQSCANNLWPAESAGYIKRILTFPFQDLTHNTMKERPWKAKRYLTAHSSSSLWIRLFTALWLISLFHFFLFVSSSLCSLIFHHFWLQPATWFPPTCVRVWLLL